MLSHISLINFRNYAQARTVFNSGLNILVGPNGAGKTNMLEAISLLAPGRGLRNATLKDVIPFSWLQNKSSQNIPGWGITARIEKDGDTHTISTGLTGEAVISLLSPNSESTPRRHIRINGTDQSSQSTLADYTSVVWLTPHMDGILSGGGSERRRFLDRLVAAHDPAHTGRLSRYEKALRQRNFLLKEKPHEKTWIRGLDKELAKTGVALAAARNHFIDVLNKSMKAMDTPFPKAIITMDGWVETLLQKNTALEAEHLFLEKLESELSNDLQKQTTGFGTHRSDFMATHSQKNTAASYCSTGEQKAMLISIIMAHATLIAPDSLILLDEIAAHLDDARRKILLSFLVDNGHQVFATGTEKKLFSSEANKASFFNTQDGQIIF